MRVRPERGLDLHRSAEEGITTPTLPKPFIFLHIPKTGGTTLTSVVRANTPPEELVHLWDRPRTSQLPAIRKKSVVFGHLFFGLHRHFSSACTYVTVLRQPVDRVISHYFYHRRTPWDPFHSIARDHSLEEWSRSFIDAQNLQVQIVSGKRGVATRDTLELAKKNLAGFGVVGILERFDETLQLMKQRLGFHELRYVILKAAPCRPEEYDVSASCHEAIVEHNLLDLELYAEAQHLFQRQLAACNARLFSA